MKLFLYISLLAAILPSRQGYGEDIENYLDYLGQVNRFSPLEGAGSHGTFGIKVGVGLQMISSKNDGLSERPQYSLQGQQIEEQETLSPKLHFTKGTPFPIDFGGSFGLIENGKAHQWAGYLQWTLFEGLALPALAARYSYSKLTGAPKAEITTQSIDGILSYGFLRFFNLFVVAGRSIHESTVYQDEGVITVGEVTSDHQGAGMEIMVIPPFTTLAIETQTDLKSYQSYYGKLSFLF